MCPWMRPTRDNSHIDDPPLWVRIAQQCTEVADAVLRRMKGKRTMKKLLFVFVALGLVAGACGGDDDDSVSVADSPLAQAISEEIQSDTDSPIAGEEEADCFAGNVVGRIGETRLNDLGVTATSVGDIADIDFSADEISTIVSSMTDCIDLQAAMAEQFEEDFAPEDAKCLAEGIGNDTLEELLALGLTSNDDDAVPEDFFQIFLDVAAECDLPLN